MYVVFAQNVRIRLCFNRNEGVWVLGRAMYDASSRLLVCGLGGRRRWEIGKYNVVRSKD